MKKISYFLAAVMLFIAVASPYVPASTVQAFAESEINDSNFHWSNSFPIEVEKVYEEVYEADYSYSLQLCDPGTGEVKYSTDATRTEQEGSLSVQVSAKMNLPDGFVDGSYKLQLQRTKTPWGGTAETDVPCYWSESFYSSRTPLSPFSCDVMNNDGYAYAYAYDAYGKNPLKNADHFPELYDINKTKVAHFESFSTENVDGTNVYVYKLKIDDPDAFQMDSTGHTTLYYMMNTKNGGATERSNVYTANWEDTEGYGYLTVFDFNMYMDKLNQSNQSNGSGSSSSDSGSKHHSSSSSKNESDSSDTTTPKDPEMQNSTATVGGNSVPITVNTIQNSEVPEVQSSINNVVSWVGQISTNTSEVVNVLKQYAPTEKVDNVITGGTLELTVPSDVDISSGVSVTFTDSSIKSTVKRGDKVIVLHVKHDGSIEYIPAVAGDGTITATFTSLSPVAWFMVETSAEGGSPKTGVSFWDFLRRWFC